MDTRADVDLEKGKGREIKQKMNSTPSEQIRERIGIGPRGEEND